MVPAILPALLAFCDVTVEEFLEFLDASAARGEPAFISDPAGLDLTGGRLPFIFVEPAADQTGEGPHLIVMVALPNTPQEVTIGEYDQRYLLEVAHFRLPHTVAVGIGGRALRDLVSHDLTDPLNLQIICCWVDEPHVKAEITMPLVPLT